MGLKNPTAGTMKEQEVDNHNDVYDIDDDDNNDKVEDDDDDDEENNNGEVDDDCERRDDHNAFILRPLSK